MLSCKDLSDKASDYFDGDLPLAARIEIKWHTFWCKHCRRYLGQLRLALDALAVFVKDGDDERGSVEEVLRSASHSRASAVPKRRRLERKVVIYTTSECPHCHKAKSLLERNGVRYVEIEIGSDPAKQQEMIARAKGRTTVPQIFIRKHSIGGWDALHTLDAAGELDRFLGRE